MALWCANLWLIVPMVLIMFAAISDLRSRLVPDWVVVCIGLWGVIVASLGLGGLDWGGMFAGLLIGLLLAVIAYWTGVWLAQLGPDVGVGLESEGGLGPETNFSPDRDGNGDGDAGIGLGDCKLLAGLGVCCGYGILMVALGAALAGGPLALWAMMNRNRRFPYVPAIAAGYLSWLMLGRVWHV